jgi:DNA primase
MMSEGMDIQNLGWSVSRTGSFERSGAVSIKVAVLPAGHDPDSLLRADGADALSQIVATARPLLSFVLERVFEEEDLTTTRGRAAAHAQAAVLLSKVGNATEATALSREAARRLGVDATQLWIEAQQLQGARVRGRRPARQDAAATSARPWPVPTLAERDLLVLLLHVEQARAELLPLVEEHDLAHPGLRLLLSALRRMSGPPEALMSEVPDEAARGLLAELLVEEREWTDSHSQVFELRKRYHIRRRRERIRQVSEAITRAQSTGDPALAALEAELRELQREAEAVRELALARPRPQAGPTPGR